MLVSAEKKKAEAIKRMEFLKLFPPIIKSFRYGDKIARSEPPFGAHYWLEDEEKAIAENFEKENNALVYTAIRSYTNIGMMTAFLFVDDYEEDWDLERDSLANNETVAYVYNHDDPEMSEMGYIGIMLTPAAGLARTW